jgi:hypothetical protein
MSNFRKPLYDPILLSALPEAQLLFCCARTALDETTVRKVETLLQQELNWKFLLQRAEQNCVLPLVSRNLLNGFRRALSHDVVDQLETFERLHTQYNLLQTGVLIKLLNLLAANRVPAIPLKGPALAVAAYGDSNLRQFGDLDILIPESHIKAAVELLVSEGYEPCQEIRWPERGNIPRNCEKDLALVGKGGHIYIELHWRLAGKNFDYPVDLNRLWKTAVLMPLDGTNVLTLPPEELLVYLCMHGSKHCWERLQWLSDIAELVKTHPNLDWDGVLKRARRRGCKRALNLGLYLAGELLGAEIPEAVFKVAASEMLVKQLADYAREWILRDPEIVHSIAEWDYVRLQMKERRRDRIRLHMHHLGRYLRINSRDRAFLPLPASLSFLYLGIRTLRLANDYARLKVKNTGKS